MGAFSKLPGFWGDRDIWELAIPGSPIVTTGILAPGRRVWQCLAVPGAICEDPVVAAVLMDAGDQVRALAGNDGARFLLLSGRPLREPIAWGGPIVMNTQAELEQAFAELDNGTFIRHPG